MGIRYSINCISQSERCGDIKLLKEVSRVSEVEARRTPGWRIRRVRQSTLRGAEEILDSNVTIDVVHGNYNLR